MGCLDGLGLSCSILAIRDEQPLYDLDLASCRRFFSEVSEDLSSPYSLERFVHEQMERSDYKDCMWPRVHDLDDALGFLANFDDKPAPVTYKLVNSDSECCLDENSLLLAHFLSLIFGRQIEHAAFACLHKHLSKPQGIEPQTMEHFIEQLLALRWRVGLDRRRHTGLHVHEPQAEVVELSSRIERDTSLCKKLYFSLCHIRQRLGRKHSGVDDPSFSDRQYRGVTNTLPREDSPEAFDDWMRQGEALIEEAGPQERNSS
ncbi:hypothetical protein HRG_005993 [Hirsutella rhossiliensis]|uniref:Uncharacterized protein n=1 Tax=Hirsutella rhossiliensis TaxID=111463 RepID=A0A9P8SHT7_9HYPO|nr:uncharacterized protein HRG_05993 [Hirsutella rhossiliensis]KAH0963483.1 hypothetical protein HRG_05993 [Hirsutella rhossiliensis]